MWWKCQTTYSTSKELSGCYPLDDLLPIASSNRIKIQQVQLFINNLVVYEREDGLLKVTVYSLPAAGKAIECLQDGQVVEFIDPVYDVEPIDSQYDSHILRFSYSSMRTPPSVYDYDMNTRVTVLKKVEAVSFPTRLPNSFVC